MIKKKTRLFWLLFFLAAGMLLRINNLAGRPLWTDEFFTLFLSTGHGLEVNELLDDVSNKPTPDLYKAKVFKSFLRQDPAKTASDVAVGVLKTDTHPPLYFLLIHFWMKVFGDNAMGVRVFSALMGIFAIFLAYQVTKYLFNGDAAIFSALFVSLAAFSVRYSQEARAYALIMVLGLSAWLFILRFQKYKKTKDIFLFALLSSLGIYVHYFFIFIVVAQFLYFTIAHKREKDLLDKFYLAFFCILLSLFPWFRLLVLYGYRFRNAEWIFGYPGIAEKFYDLFTGLGRYLFIIDTAGIISALLLSIGAFVLLCYIIFSASKDLLRKYPKQFLQSLFMFLFPIVGMLCIDIIQHGALLKQERFWMFAFLGIIPILGYSLHYNFLKNRIFTFLVILGVCLSSLIASTNLQFGPAPKYVSSWINEESGEEEAAVILYNMRSVVFAQGYYLDDHIYLVPVSDEEQLNKTLDLLSEEFDKIFICRHYHRTDASLQNPAFMEKPITNSRFKFKTEIQRDEIRISEYTRCAL